MYLRLLTALILGWALPVQAMNLQLSHSDDEAEDIGGDSNLNHRFLFAEGIIVPGDALNLKALLEDQFESRMRTVILLTSKGGVLEEVEALRHTILTEAKEYFNHYRQKLVVLVNLECSSACNILLAGLTQGAAEANLEIHVANSAKLGFHSPVDITNEKTTPIKSKKKFDADLAKMLKAYQSYGVSHAWLNSQSSILRNPKMTEIAAQKICASKAGIIPADSCYDDSGNRDILTEVSINIQGNKPLFKKTVSKEN